MTLAVPRLIEQFEQGFEIGFFNRPVLQTELQRLGVCRNTDGRYFE